MFPKISTTLFLAASSVGICFFAQAAEMPDSQQVTNLLSDLKTHAYQLSEDADTMYTFTFSPSSNWESHAAVVDRIKDDINESGKKLAELERIKKTASPWQMAAIDRTMPLLKELANRTEKVISFINEKPERLFEEQYTHYLEANADVSSELSSMISDFIDYGKAKQRTEMLESKLEIPVSK